jgi:formamidopyrimidine-DNA glycosylase
MLELPEVITIRDQMRRALLGKEIREMSVLDRESLKGTIRSSMVTQTAAEFRDRLQGGVIRDIRSHLNSLHIYLASGSVVFLGAIYGTVLYHETSKTLPKRRYLHLIFSDDSHLTVTITFFGTIRAFASKEWEMQAEPDYERDALDPSADSFTWEQFSESLGKWPGVSKLSAKKLVTSCIPTYIGGIGNGYLQEILYRAALHPKRKMGSLETDEAKRYFESMKQVVREATQKGGRNSELDLFGSSGGFIPHVSKDTVGTPCTICGTAIEKFSFEGGACYVCPGCQQR